MSVQIHNPFPGGSSYTSEKKAAEYIRRGKAIRRADGTLQFISRPANEAARFWSNPLTGPHFWNGARNYPGACYPPGCNVSFPKNGTAEAARRYATRTR